MMTIKKYRSNETFGTEDLDPYRLAVEKTTQHYQSEMYCFTHWVIKSAGWDMDTENTVYRLKDLDTDYVINDFKELDINGNYELWPMNNQNPYDGMNPLANFPHPFDPKTHD